MAYMGPPVGTTATIVLNEVQQDIPKEVDEWLLDRGWGRAICHGGTGEDMFVHSKFSGLYFHWYEAVACEFYWFINLGSKK